MPGTVKENQKLSEPCLEGNGPYVPLLIGLSCEVLVDLREGHDIDPLPYVSRVARRHCEIRPFGCSGTQTSFVPVRDQRLWRTVMRRKYQLTRNQVQFRSARAICGRKAVLSCLAWFR